MTKSNRTRKQIKNYYRVKEALYKYFPKASIVDYPFNYSIYIDASYFFKNEGQFILIYYNQDRLLYPHHLEYVHNLPYYEYTGVACVDKENRPITNYSNYIMNLSPTPKDIENICNFISKEIIRMKEHLKLQHIKEDF